MGGEGPELEGRVDELFLRMFVGARINPKWTGELVEDCARWENEREKNWEKAPEHFLDVNIPDDLRDKIIEVLEKIKRGNYDFIPSEKDKELIEYWDAVQWQNLFDFHKLAQKVFLRASRSNIEAYAPYHIRNVAEVRSTLVSHVCKYHWCFGRRSIEAIENLEAAEWLKEYIANQQVDMMMYLAKERNNGFVGFIIRNKTRERMARKVAENFIALLKKYDRQLKPQAERKKKKGPGFNPNGFTFKDFLFTDQLAFSEVFADDVNFDYKHIFRIKKSERPVQLEKKDADSYYIKPEGIRQDRIKIFHPWDGWIYDFHAIDIPSIAAREAGKAAYHIFVARRHKEHLTDTAKTCRSKLKLSYGEIYKAIYSRALKFFNACAFRSLEPTIFEYHCLKPSKKAGYLVSLVENLRTSLGLEQEDIEKFLRRYASLTKKSPGQERKVYERMQRELKKAYDGDGKFFRIERTLYSTLACHFLELQRLLSDESTRLFNYSVYGVNLSLAMKPTLISLVTNLDFLSKLYSVLYNGTTNGRLLDKEKETFDLVNDDFELLVKTHQKFLALKQEIVESACASPSFANISSLYSRFRKEIGELDNAIASTRSNYPAMVLQSAEARVVFRSHALELQYKLYNALKVKGKAETGELNRLAAQLIEDKSKFDALYKETEKSLARRVQSMYSQQRRQFERCIEANLQ